MSTAVTSRSAGRPENLGAWATHTLAQLILDGNYRPGERLREERIAEELGVSRPPVREALHALAAAGLVEHRARRGARVRVLTQDDVYEIVTLRAGLERMALDLVAQDGIDPRRWQECQDALGQMRAAAASDDEAAMLEASLSFHVAVVALSGHMRLVEAYRRMALQLQLCMRLNLRASREIEDLDANVRRHERLLAVIHSGDSDALARELADHGDRVFLLEAVDGLPGPTERSTRWLSSLRETGASPGTKES